MDMESSTKRILLFSLRHSNKGFQHAIGKDVQLTTSNAFFSIAHVVSIGSGLMMLMYTKIRRGEQKIIVESIPLHQIKSCRLYQ